MIDPADNQTQKLPLVQTKRGRGRPATGAAMTPAEKQRAYRQRQAEQRSTQVPIKTIEIITEETGTQIASLEKQLAEAKVKILELEQELKKSNVKLVDRYQIEYKEAGKKAWRKLQGRGSSHLHWTEESAMKSVNNLKKKFETDQYRIKLVRVPE